MSKFIENGKCLYTVVLPANETEECKFAVKELTYVIEKSCGNPIKVITEQEDLPEKCCSGKESCRPLGGNWRRYKDQIRFPDKFMDLCRCEEIRFQKRQKPLGVLGKIRKDIPDLCRKAIFFQGGEETGNRQRFMLNDRDPDRGIIRAFFLTECSQQ